MNKYTSLVDNIYSIFSSPSWIATTIKTYPENFSGSNSGNEFIRISILPVDDSLISFPKSVKGQMIVDIFTAAGEGTKRGAQIADLLDTHIVGRTIALNSSGNVQFGNSSLNSVGIDRANSSIYRFIYSVSFNYFGT